MKVLLDTSTFVWLASAPHRLSERARGILNDQSNELYLSQASFWEMAEKVRKGQLRLPESPQQWILDRMTLHGVEEAALDAETLFLGAGLPGQPDDFVDRLLVAQSLREGFSLLSPDSGLTLLGALVLW
jgi:PIN domain nuclease of toxin-antitoxin system